MTLHVSDVGHLPPIRTMLGVWAHPDDEAYLSSGLMSRVRQLGGRVVVVTATRERELKASLAEVGVHEHHWLRYRDGELDRVTPDRGADDLVPLMEEIRPDVIVTFGPEGMTGHPDHRAISAWTTEAWRRTGRRGDLWHATLTPEFHREWGELNAEVGLWTTTPPVTPEAELSASVRLGGSLLRRKHRALRAHASQTRALEDLVGSDRYRSWWATENFVAVVRQAPYHVCGTRSDLAGS
jgi:LmbE family N-acetylglucosaminyl deacetylase